MQRYNTPNYAALAEFRYQIRQFLKTSEQEAQRHGLEAQQYQLLLAIRGMPQDDLPTIGRLAERLLLKHHSTVELVNRLEEHGAVRRERDGSDQRRVLVRLEPEGERLLAQLAAFHESELQARAPALMRSLEAVVDASSREAPQPESGSLTI